MSSNDENNRKRKATIIPDAISSNDRQNPKEDSFKAWKAHRGSTNASTSIAASLEVASVPTAASLQVDTLVATENANTVNTFAAAAAAAATKQEESMESSGQMIQDLFHSDNSEVSDALDALKRDLKVDNQKRESFVTAGGCLALVRLIKYRLKKARKKVPACDHVIELNESPELETLRKTLGVLTTLTLNHNESKVGISSVGGVEAVVKVVKMFPMCRVLQVCACGTLTKLTECNLGKKKAVETGAMELLLAAINNHLDAYYGCYFACAALSNIIEKEDKENIRLFISLGGATAVAKLREEWPDDNVIQAWVRSHARLIGTAMKNWTEMQVDTPVAAEKVTAVIPATAAATHEDSIEFIGALVQDLIPFGNAKVDATLDALNLDLKGDKKKCDKIQVVGGCLALIQVLKKSLDKATDERPVWDQVTEVNELAELTTLHKTLHIMIRLTHHLDESKVGAAAIGGVEAVVKAMITFPQCQALQEFACILLLNLSSCSVGKKRVVEAGGMIVLLTAINNHLNSDNLCKYACTALCSIILKENKEEKIRLLISLGGATTVAKVRKEWPEGNAVQACLKLAELVGSEMTSWAEQRELQIVKIE
jgi:hypothetical protein